MAANQIGYRPDAANKSCVKKHNFINLHSTESFFRNAESGIWPKPKWLLSRQSTGSFSFMPESRVVRNRNFINFDFAPLNFGSNFGTKIKSGAF
jgi:hypothetical protein